MTNPYLKVLLKYGPSFLPVVPFNPEEEKLITLDFTSNNHSLTEELLNNISLFEDYIDKQLRDAGARYGIGGYGELRKIYSRSSLFDAGAADEPRRLHLGTDIWGQAGTPVSTALPAMVHSWANNNTSGDYGATIILQHELDEVRFFTLYGHLSADSLLGLEPGLILPPGREFARFGIPAENGNWPPHLHFQIITDPGDRKGDYPGVCRFSEKEIWMRNSPQPDLILKMNRYISP
ncbi:MAG: peptidoglycan DD-metalloendopeptidase family protein [Chitinophagaceae bacterium]